MKLTTATLLTVFHKPIVELTEEEFDAITFVLDWTITLTMTRRNEFRFRFIHMNQEVEVKFVWMLDQAGNRTGITAWVGNVEAAELLKFDVDKFCMHDLIDLCRKVYLREYAVTWWKHPRGEYSQQELHELSDLLSKTIFA